MMQMELFSEFEADSERPDLPECGEGRESSGKCAFCESSGEMVLIVGSHGYCAVHHRAMHLGLAQKVDADQGVNQPGAQV